jgi:hypothetical protein
MASAFGMTAGNNHFRKLDACFHSSRVAGEARVKIDLIINSRKNSHKANSYEPLPNKHVVLREIVAWSPQPKDMRP